MSIKVKGEAIKEGSIPLSALSSEIKNKLGNDKYKKLDWSYNDGPGACAAESQTNKIIINEETYDLTDETIGIVVNGKEYGFNYNNYYGGYLVVAYGSYEEDIDILTNNVFILNETPSAVTPDWNAQNGEAGYIENKTHYLEGKLEYTLGKGVTQIPHQYAHFASFDNKIIKIPDFVEGLEFSILSGPPVSIKYIISETGPVLELIDPANYFVNNIIEFYRNIKTIDPVYIPDKVLKTTPQTLSDDDKNQALANLGIDPVVWKYMFSPVIIYTGDPVNTDVLKNGKLKLMPTCCYYISDVIDDYPGIVVNPPDEDGQLLVVHNKTLYFYYADTNNNWARTEF